MSPELSTIVVAAVALDAPILCQGQHLGQRIDRLDRRLTAEIVAFRESQRRLGEPVARLEGMIGAAFRLKLSEAA